MRAGSQKLFSGVIGSPCLLQSCCLGRREQLFHGTSELHTAISSQFTPCLEYGLPCSCCTCSAHTACPAAGNRPRVLSCPAANGDCRGPVAGVLPCPAVPPWGEACAPQYPAQQGCLHLRGGTVNQERKCFEAAFPAMSTAGEGTHPCTLTTTLFNSLMFPPALQALQSINIAEERVTDQEQQQVALAAGAAVAAGGGPMLAAHNPNLTAALHLGGATIYGGGFNASPALQQLVLQQQQLESLGRAQSPHVGAQGHGQGMLASAALASGGFPQSPSGAGAYSAAQQQQQQLAQVISLQQLAAAAAAAQQMGNPLAHPGGHQQMGLWPQGAPAADMASLASSLLTGSSAGPASQPYAGGLPHGQLAPEYVHHSFPQSGYPPQSAPAPAGALPFQGGSASLPLPPSATSVDSQNMQSWGGLLPQTGSLLHASSLQVRLLEVELMGSAAECVSLKACCMPASSR